MSVRGKCLKLLERPTRPVGEWLAVLEPLGEEESRLSRRAESTKGLAVIGQFLLPSGFALCVRPLNEFYLYDTEPVFLVMAIVAIHFAAHHTLRWLMSSQGREYRVRWLRWLNVPTLIFGPMFMLFVASQTELEPMARLYLGAAMGCSSFFFMAVPVYFAAAVTDRRIATVLVPLLEEVEKRYGKDLQTTLTIDPVPVFARVHAIEGGKKSKRQEYQSLFTTIEAEMPDTTRLHWEVTAFGTRTSRKSGTTRNPRVDITYQTHARFFLKFWFPAVSYQPAAALGEKKARHFGLHLEERDGEWMAGVAWSTYEHHPDKAAAVANIIPGNVEAALGQVRRMTLR